MIVRSFRLSDYSEVTGLLAEVFSEECYRDTMEAFANQLSWDSELVMWPNETTRSSGSSSERSMSITTVIIIALRSHAIISEKGSAKR